MEEPLNILTLPNLRLASPTRRLPVNYENEGGVIDRVREPGIDTSGVTIPTPRQYGGKAIAEFASGWGAQPRNGFCSTNTGCGTLGTDGMSIGIYY